MIYKAVSFEGSLIALACVIAIGVLLFALTGFIRVKKGHVAIIEKTALFVGIYRSGLYYFAPLLYRRVGMYPTKEITRHFVINRQGYILTYQIVNFKKYHYEGHHDIESVLKASLNDNADNLTMALIERSKRIGVRFIKLEKIKDKRH